MDEDETRAVRPKTFRFAPTLNNYGSVKKTKEVLGLHRAQGPTVSWQGKAITAAM